MDASPIVSGQDVPGLPSPERNQADARGQVSLDAGARDTFEFHKRGLDARRLRDLTSEKYLLHIDGEGDAQWLDLFNGVRLSMIPVLNGASPTSDNQLRPIVDNFVAHLTTQPYRFVVEARRDRRSRESAMVDQAIINSDVRAQKWNLLFAEAKYIASAAGFCPIHAMWRDETAPQQEGVIQISAPGSVDNWVGNPFDHVFNAGARRGSLYRQTFGRSLPAEIVRGAFPDASIEGTTTMPSASMYQRVAQKWMRNAGMRHGYSELSSGRGHEEIIALVYDEILPGVHPDYPQGLLRIIALNGAGSTRPEDSRSPVGRPELLWEGPLPAGVFSSVNTYSHHRFDDIHGNPYVADVDDDQVELNQVLALLKDYERRASKPSLGGSGSIDVDTVGFEGDAYFEMEPTFGGTGADLQWLEYPNAHVPHLMALADRIYERMYRKAGWQAASRGEHTTGSGKAIIALQQADDSIMGPISQRTAEEAEDLAQLNWRLRKQFMDVPTVLEHVGDELAHMAEPYVERTMMSENPPNFRMVSGFGTSTEARAQQLLNLIGVVDPLGEPVLTTREFKKAYPDNSLYVEPDDSRDVRERRPRQINQMIRDAADEVTQQLTQQFPQWQPSMADPFTQQAGLIAEMQVAQQEDILMDDDLALHVETLSIITQDPTEDPVARRAAMQRQMRLYMWMAGQQEAAAAQVDDPEAQSGPEGPEEEGVIGAQGDRPSAEEAFNPAAEGGTANAQSMVQADRDFSREVA